MKRSLSTFSVFLLLCGASPARADDEVDLVLKALSDAFSPNVKGPSGTGKLSADESARLAKLATSDNRELAALAKDAQTLMELRLRSEVANRAWLPAALKPADLRAQIVDHFLRKLGQAETDENRQGFSDDLLDMIQLRGVNNARAQCAGELLSHLEKIQKKSLAPILKARFPKASPEGGAATLSVVQERKQAEEGTMILANTGKTSLHNVVVWFHIEMKPQPGMGEKELNELSAAYLLGKHREAIKKLRDQQLQAWATALGSRNIAFVPELKSGEEIRIAYQSGSVLLSSRAVFSLNSDELKITDRDISGVQEMKEWIGKGMITVVPGRSVPEPGASTDLFYKGSVWRGVNQQPTSEIIVLERKGDDFRAEIRWSGRHGRFIEGTVKDGVIAWHGAKGEPNPGSDHTGKIDGKVMECEFIFNDVKHTPKFEYVPPK